MSELEEFPLEVQAAFLGDAPLLSVLPRFASVDELYKAYARFHQQACSVETIDRQSCEWCRVESPDCFYLLILWSMRIRWRPQRIATAVVLVPILFFFHFWGFHFEKMTLDDSVEFVTYHTICRGCRSRLRRRSFLRELVKLMTNFAAYLAATGTVILLGVMVLGFLEQFGFEKSDVRRYLGWFVLAALATVLLMWIRKAADRRMLRHFSTATRVKAPFTCEDFEFRTTKTVCLPLKLV